MVDLLAECVPTFGYQWEINNPEEVDVADGGEEKTEENKRDVPNYLEEKPIYFDARHDEWLARDKTFGATAGFLGTQSGRYARPIASSPFLKSVIIRRA